MHSGWMRRSAGRIRRLIDAGDFSGKEGTTSLLYTDGAVPAERICLVGLGKRDRFGPDRLKAAAAVAVRRLADLGVESVALPAGLAASTGIDPSDAARDAVCGAALGAYSFDLLKGNHEKKKGIRPDHGRGRRRDRERGDGGPHHRRCGLGRARPRQYAGQPHDPHDTRRAGARDRDKRAASKLEVYGKKEIEALNMGALLGVARGSSEPPVFIVVKYLPKGKEKSPVALVGKGITFDSGGISLKPPENMDRMKTDMSGAAAVLCAVSAAARLRLPIGVVGVIPATENMPGPGATKPGDVLTAMSGTTIEVISTDAEGRLILADAITYAKKFGPRAVVDIATLTGSAVIALGGRVAALYSSDNDLLEKIKEASRISGEQVWPMPLFDHYFERIKGDVADLKNAAGRDGGSITAAAFLKTFAGDEIPWAHLDIAGTARAEKGYDWVAKGATGWGVMTFIFLLSLLCRKVTHLHIN